jgi:hypothetical protein
MSHPSSERMANMKISMIEDRGILELPVRRRRSRNEVRKVNHLTAKDSVLLLRLIVS